MTTPVAGATNTNNILQSYLASQQSSADADAAAAAATSNATSGDTTNSIASVSANYNTFIKILTAQLQNQDPLAAQDTNQFTQELVEFSGVEQQLATNSKLDTLIGQTKTAGTASLLGYVGAYIEAPANGAMLVQGGKASMAYTLPAASANTTIVVKDGSGDTVATLNGPTTAGLNRITWDGSESDGSQAPDGVYSFTLGANDLNGNALTVTDTRFVGQVTGLSTDGTGVTTLTVGGLSVPDNTVDAVFSTIGTTPADTSSPSS